MGILVVWVFGVLGIYPIPAPAPLWVSPRNRVSRYQLGEQLVRSLPVKGGPGITVCLSWVDHVLLALTGHWHGYLIQLCYIIVLAGGYNKCVPLCGMQKSKFRCINTRPCLTIRVNVWYFKHIKRPVSAGLVICTLGPVHPPDFPIRRMSRVFILLCIRCRAFFVAFCHHSTLFAMTQGIFSRGEQERRRAALTFLS